MCLLLWMYEESIHQSLFEVGGIVYQRGLHMLIQLVRVFYWDYGLWEVVEN